MRPKLIYIFGWYVASDGYPNVKWFLDGLDKDKRFILKYISKPRNTGRLDQIALKSKIYGGLIFLRSLLPLIKELYNLIRAVKQKEPDLIYVPYPSLIPVFLLIVFAKKYCSKLAIDSFISIYDTVVNDRRLVKKQSIFAKFIYFVERATFLKCKYVFVDTECNKDFYIKIFRIPESLVISLPLASDEFNYNCHAFAHPKREGAATYRVLFVGTFVPLHGIEAIIKAIELLESHSELEFRVIGDGQQGHLLEEWLKGKSLNVVWVREWMSAKELAKEISEADICLGVFGTSDKAKRVLPLKLYSYMSMAKPIITAECDCFPENVKRDVSFPCASIKSGDYEQLAKEIMCLSNDDVAREQLGKKAYEFYSAYLSNSQKLDSFHKLLDS